MHEHVYSSLSEVQRIGTDTLEMHLKQSAFDSSSLPPLSFSKLPHNLFPSSSALIYEPSSPDSSTTPPLNDVEIAVSKQDEHVKHWKPLLPPDTQRVLPKNVCPELCKICGDTATAYHYEVPTCNGCKTFFRRAILGQRKFICNKNGECKQSMTKELRVKCRACRFDRCVEAGMNPLGVLSEKNPDGNWLVRDIMRKRKSLLERQGLPHPPDQQSTSSAMFKIFVHPQAVENTMDLLIDELMHLEVAYDRIRNSNHCPDPWETRTVDDAIKGHSRLGVDFGVAPPRLTPHGKPQMKFIPMGVRIRDRIPFEMPPDKREDGVESTPKVWPFLDLIHAIDYLKTFDFFHELPENDKRVLAKSVAVLTVFITNSFYAFECKSDVTIHPDGYIPHGGLMLEWAGHSEARHDIEMHYETVQRVKALNLDKKEYVIIKALIACNPAIEDLTSVSRKIMQEQRDRYAKSLMSYVMAARGFVKGPSFYAEIMSYVDWLTRLAQRNKDIHVLICALGLKHPMMPPLMDEILG